MNPEIANSLKAIILPGVGAFSKGMDNLRELGVLPGLSRAIKGGKPLLGICLGLQLLFSESEEHGICAGLGVFKGRVRKFVGDIKIPHMGWNTIKTKSRDDKARPEIFENVSDEAYFYFVHSYFVDPEDERIIVATTGYGVDFVSVVNKDNVWGVQFHPEKSDRAGLRVLKNFLSGAERIE